jgi:hypothetical protein
MTGPPRKCECGECPTCKNRAARRKHYQVNRLAIIRKNVERRSRLRQSIREVSDEEMDRRALAMQTGEQHAAE